MEKSSSSISMKLRNTKVNIWGGGKSFTEVESVCLRTGTSSGEGYGRILTFIASLAIF